MISATEHDLAVELAKARAAGDLSPLEKALLARISAIEEVNGEQKEYVRRLERIEEEAGSVYRYHRSGNSHDDDYDEVWDANEMISRLNDLGEALEQ
ncbi:hypothetical protein [Novosphingobium sp. 9]|uniref:hypothetical protein n=1 Tax=Novosphingobium sp. 9 TaxID=2025349 RepID=UPI0021B5524D|nr:hypothetical protein [Novosphingobium sp. 9]